MERCNGCESAPWERLVEHATTSVPEASRACGTIGRGTLFGLGQSKLSAIIADKGIFMRVARGDHTSLPGWRCRDGSGVIRESC